MNQIAQILRRLVTRGGMPVLVIASLALLPAPEGQADDDSRHARRHGARDRGKAKDRAGDRHRDENRVRVEDCLPIAEAGDRDDDDGDQRRKHRGRDDDDDGDRRRKRRDREDRPDQRTCAPLGSSSGIARGDFNGDGFADLAVGVPGEETPSGVSGSGAVTVIYGSANGLTATSAGVPASQFWSQNAAGVPDVSEVGDGFGSALAAGDFNGDDFSDLAVGVPGEDTALARDSGTVTVIFGSAGGLTTTGTSAQIFHVGSFPGFADLAFANEDFGRALAWGDFNGDGVGDLAVGAPGFGSFDICAGTCVCATDPDCFGAAGGVFVLFGSAGSGLAVQNAQFWDLDDGSIPDAGTRGDRFGEALVGGDFDGDDVTDLAIGIPFWDVPFNAGQGAFTQDVGAVLVLSGSPNGLSSAGNRFFDECTSGRFPPSCPTTVSVTGARFGRALAAGDFDGDGRDDLAMAAPFRAVGATLPVPISIPQAGAVRVKHGPLGENDPQQFWHQSLVFPGSTAISERDGTGSPTEAGDFFGTALAAGDFDADGRRDLAVGVPFEDVLVQLGATSFATVRDAGAVSVIYGSANGLSITGRAPQFWNQQSINIEDDAEVDDRFGSRLTAWNFGRNETRQICNPITHICAILPIGIADLAIGVPRENIGSVADAGAVNVLYGSTANGLSFSNDQFWHQNSPGISGAAEANDRFGDAVY